MSVLRIGFVTELFATVAFVIGNASIAYQTVDTAVDGWRCFSVSCVALSMFARLRASEAAGKDRQASQARARTVRSLFFFIEAVLVFSVLPTAFWLWLMTAAFAAFSTRDVLVPKAAIATGNEAQIFCRSFVSALAGSFVVVGVTGTPLSSMGASVIALAVANWSLFGLFQLVQHAQSFSGLGGLSSRLASARVGLFCIALVTLPNSLLLFVTIPGAQFILGASTVALVVALFYSTGPRPDRALIFRATMSAFMLAFYTSLATSVFFV